MKKHLAVFLALFFLIFTAAYAGSIEDKKVRDDFYSMLNAKLGFDKAEIKVIKACGLGPQFGLTLLYIAREAKKPVSEAVALRVENGWSPQEICEEFGLDFEKTIEKMIADIAKYNIQFPPETDTEMKKNIVTGLKKAKEAK